MLKISGTDGSQVSSAGTGLRIGKEDKGEAKGTAKGAGAGLTDADFQALMSDFDQRMTVLRTVVEAGNDVGSLKEGGADHDVEKDGDGRTV
jgi:hypothetical protein